MTDAGLWPWFVVAGLGLYHGINPAMGWLFAVALGLHRKSRRVVLYSLLPICASSAPGSQLTSEAAIPLALAALAVHTLAMLAAIAVVSLAVYDWIGVAFLRRGWINLDLVWIGALLACGIVLLLS